jgi:hypothetical protein
VHEPGDDENIGRKVMEVADQFTISQCGHDVKDPVVGDFMIRNVVKKERKTCRGKHDEAGQADNAQAQGSERL